MEVTAKEMFLPGNTRYFGIIDNENGVRIGTVILTSMDGTYSWSFYDSLLAKGMPLNIAWIRAVKAVTSNLVIEE